MFFENIKEAITSIFCNKMRSILTMLGIIIGISSVITITTIGSSIKSTLNSTLNSLGGSSIMVYLEANYPENDADFDTWIYPVLEEEDLISEEMIQTLLSTYPDTFTGIAANCFFSNGTVKKDKNTYSNVSVQGCTDSYLKYLKLNILKGRSISSLDCEKKKKVCIIADTMAENYFGKENPIGQQIYVDFETGESLNCVVIGVYEYNAALFGDGMDNSIPEKDRTTTMFFPYQTINTLSGNEQNGYENFDILVNPASDLKEADELANSFFEPYYEKNEDWSVMTYNMSSDMGMINTVINVITIAISGIAAISLIVGGVGVMNIMLVSITERTKEIGVRMALGANRKIIKTQFVIEAIVLCLIGGIIGILIGILNGVLLGKVAEFMIQSMYSQYADYIIMSVHPSLTAVLLSLFFSMLTGIFFGYYPANKASKMEVIDALRYE